MKSMKTPSLTEIINYNLHAQPKHFIYQQWFKTVCISNHATLSITDFQIYMHVYECRKNKDKVGIKHQLLPFKCVINWKTITKLEKVFFTWKSKIKLIIFTILPYQLSLTRSVYLRK